jgi:hypothetical protein
MRGTGPFDFVADAANKVSNEFTNKDSLTGQAFKSAEQALGSLFDPNKNGLREKLGAAIDKFKKFTEQLPADLKAGLDPNQNGVAEAFQKFGQNTNGAFEEIGRRILARTGVDLAALELAFGPIRDELLRVDSEIGKFMLQQLGTQEDWKKKFEDPDTYFVIASILLTAAAAVVAAPAASTVAMGFFAVNLGMACAQALMHAAQGKPFSAADGIGIGMAIFGPALGRMGSAAFQSAYKALSPGYKLFKAGAPVVAPGILSALGKAAVIPIASNQAMFNVRGMGQTFTAVSTANMETGGSSPVDLPEPPAAPAQPSDPNRVATGPSTFTNMKDTPTTIDAYGKVVPISGPNQVKPSSNQFSNPAGGGTGMNEFSPTYNYSVAGQKVFEPGEKISADDFMKSLYGRGRPKSIIAHAQMHRRGRRKSHDSIDSAHFC